jgi:hypothetical protein
MNTNYCINLPVYQYNTGRADNGNTIFKIFYKDKSEASSNLEFINKCFAKIENDELLTEEESQRYDRFFDLPGYQIDDAYLTILTEELL